MSNMALPLPAWQQRGTNDPRVPITHFGVANMKRLVKSILSLAVIALGTGSAAAGAITAIDFQTGSAGPGGTLTIAGSNATGSGIFIDTVTISGAPVNNGVFDVDGLGVCADLVGGCGLLSFNGINTITLVGSIPALGILAPITLLSGDLSGPGGVLFNTGSTGSAYGSGVDTKSRELLSAIGLDPATQFAWTGFVTGVNLLNQGSPYTAISTDITNTSLPGAGGSGQTLVPEPGSLMLFGTGLVGVASRLRRRYSNKG